MNKYHSNAAQVNYPSNFSLSTVKEELLPVHEYIVHMQEFLEKGLSLCD